MAEGNLFACVIEIYSDLWLGGLETDFVQCYFLPIAMVATIKLYSTVLWGSLSSVSCGSIGKPITVDYLQGTIVIISTAEWCS